MKSEKNLRNKKKSSGLESPYSGSIRQHPSEFLNEIKLINPEYESTARFKNQSHEDIFLEKYLEGLQNPEYLLFINTFIFISYF